MTVSVWFSRLLLLAGFWSVTLPTHAQQTPDTTRRLRVGEVPAMPTVAVDTVNVLPTAADTKGWLLALVKSLVRKSHLTTAWMW